MVRLSFEDGDQLPPLGLISNIIEGAQMNLKHSNSWHKTLYGKHFAKSGLDSKARHSQAHKEVKFLIDNLELKKGSKVLDVPCGTGRHALAFGKRGMEVVAVDISPSCLKLARTNCKGHKNIKVKSGDMGKLTWARNKFDVVTNMFSSFGYFKTASENKKTLQGFKNAVIPGGAVVIQTINREWLLRVFDPARWGGKVMIITGRKAAAMSQTPSMLSPTVCL